jgi:hypothetical protein
MGDEAGGSRPTIQISLGGYTMLDRDGSLTGVVEVLGDTKPVGAKRYVYALADYSEIEPKPALARLFT